MLLTIASLGSFAVGCTAAASGTTASSSGTASGSVTGIQPMTTVTEKPKQGYFSDPYPIHLAASDASALPQSFSGTTPDLLSCAGAPTKGCFREDPITVAIGPDLARQISAAGASLKQGFNNNIFQDDSGAWQMAVTYYVSNTKFPKAQAWTAILHAHAADKTRNAIPTSWVADTLLVGSFSQPTKADYDGKYFENAKKLYLIYSDRLSDNPSHDGIVAQPMASPSKPTSDKPTTLLAPGGYNSELFFGLNQPNPFKLIETGNITEVDGKFVLAYSTGAYYSPDHKIGLAWSDTFLPTSGAGYRKITMTDTAGVWGKKGQSEVRYLLQSQEKGWPNYVGQTVLAPGVPSVVEDAQHWYLFFAGYLPSNAPTDPASGHYQPAFRRPYFAPLAIDIPTGSTVSGTSEAALADWITVDANQ